MNRKVKITLDKKRTLYYTWGSLRYLKDEHDLLVGSLDQIAEDWTLVNPWLVAGLRWEDPELTVDVLDDRPLDADDIVPIIAKVINAMGGLTEVDEVTSQRYEGDVVRLDVEANRWNDLEVTPEHPFLVLRSSRISRHHHRVRDEYKVEHRETRVEIDYSPEWVEAKDIEVGDCLIVPNASGQADSLSTERARLVGYYLAEGNVNFDGDTPRAVTWTTATGRWDRPTSIRLPSTRSCRSAWSWTSTSG